MSDQEEIIEIDENGKVVRDTTRKYTQAEYDDALQSATERLPCGHWKGDWVEGKDCDRECFNELADGRHHLDCAANRPSYCRICKEILERTAAAMAAQRDADAEHYPIFFAAASQSYFKCHACNWDSREAHELGWSAHMRSRPLASAPEQKWLDRQLAVARLDEAMWWTQRTGFHNLADGTEQAKRITKLEAEATAREGEVQ